MATPIRAVTAGARGSIYVRTGARAASRWSYFRCFAHRRDPRDVASVHIDHTRLSIDGGTAPFTTAVEAGQHDCPLATGWREQRVVPQSAKAMQRSVVSTW